MNLKKLACVASLVLALSSGAFAASSSRWEQWLNSYYQNPQPDLVVRATYGLSSDGYFEQPGAVPTAIGFYSQVFAANPERVDSWFANFRELPQSEQRLLASALWYAGNPKGEKLLRRLAAAGSDYRADIDRLTSAPSQSVSATPVLSDSSMNLQWGAFLASGGEQHITAILDGMGRGNLGDSARVGLAFAAAHHPRVLEICRTQLDRQPNEVRSVLRAVINDAERKQPPSS
ncbi:MAG TPA: hypothetical protein VGD81_00405 [Opitutaceae bacterium]